MQCLVSGMLMGLVVEFEPEELPVELRRCRQIGGPNLQAVDARHNRESSTGSMAERGSHST
jgi:hypothetical protein